MKLLAPTTFCWALLALLGTAQGADRPTHYRPPRLPDGHVDMQGIWKNSNLTPLERAPEFTQLTITAADAKRLEAVYYLGPDGPNQPDDPGRVLEARSFEPIRGELRSSQIIDPDDGKIPWKDGYRETAAALRRAAVNAFDNPEERPPLDRCLYSNGAPPMQPSIDGNIFQFVQTPTAVAIVSEKVHDVRVVRLNATHSPAVITSWLGDSVGWWEGDTLVVETKYFSPSSADRSSARNIFLVSPETTVMERFTRVSEHELNYIFVVSDPTYYTRSWTGETHLLRSNVKMYEYACHEGNYSMRNILEAARAQDAKEGSTIAPTNTK